MVEEQAVRVVSDFLLGGEREGHEGVGVEALGRCLGGGAARSAGRRAGEGVARRGRGRSGRRAQGELGRARRRERAEEGSHRVCLCV